MEDNERVLNRDGVDALWGRTKDLVEDRVGLTDLPVYTGEEPLKRGQAFRIQINGEWKAYRMKISQDEAKPFAVNECERLNLRTLAHPLAIENISSICN